MAQKLNYHKLSRNNYYSLLSIYEYLIALMSNLETICTTETVKMPRALCLPSALYRTLGKR